MSGLSALILLISSMPWPLLSEISTRTKSGMIALLVRVPPLRNLLRRTLVNLDGEQYATQALPNGGMVVDNHDFRGSKNVDLPPLNPHTVPRISPEFPPPCAVRLARSTNHTGPVLHGARPMPRVLNVAATSSFDARMPMPLSHTSNTIWSLVCLNDMPM